MKRILYIIRHDLRKITGSVVAMITILGLCIVPCLYAWFNIFSNWAPYESSATGRIKVAVANMDEGYNAAGLEINVGEKIVEALEANDAIGWVIVDDEESAKEGVYASDYYAAIVMPESFSADVLSFTRGDLTNPTIRYYENEKMNAIAPKITGKAQTALQQEVNNAFIETLAGYITDAASIAEANGLDPADAMADLADRIEDLSGDINGCIALANSAAGLTDAAGDLLAVSDNFIGSTQKVLSANDKVLEEAEQKLSEDKKIDTGVIDKAAEDSKNTETIVKPMKDTVIDVIGAGDIAYKLFMTKNRDEWITRVDKLKANADEQAKLVNAEGFTALGSEFEALSDTLGDISANLSSLKEDMTSAERDAILQTISDDIDKAVDLTGTIQKQIRDDIDKNVEKALNDSRKTLSAFRKTMSDADRDLGSLSRTMDSYNGSIKSLKSSIKTTADNLRALQDGAYSVAGLLNDASGNELMREISEMMGNDEAAVAEYLANPIKMRTEVIWPIETYGSAMAPFYTVLAQWVGALLTAVLIKVKVRKRKELDGLRLHEWYFGRYGLYLLIGLAQALIVSLGDLLYIGIQCAAPLRFVLAACVNGIVFMMINYALVFALDNIGLGAGVIILVLQVAGSGGTYPVEVLPAIFRTLFPLMPFRYSMDAMRECIGGMYDGTYWKCLGILALFFLFFTAFGLAMYKPAKRLNDTIAASKAKSEIML